MPGGHFLFLAEETDCRASQGPVEKIMPAFGRQWLLRQGSNLNFSDPEPPFNITGFSTTEEACLA